MKPAAIDGASCALLTAALVALGAAGCVHPQTTPEQEATWAAMQACDRYPGVMPDRVDAHGRYWFNYTSAANVGEFQACVARERARMARSKYASAAAVDRVYDAYFIAAPPPVGSMLTQPPPKHAIFTRDAPVLFYYDLWSAGRPTHASFKWYAPDGTLAAQESRLLSDSAATDRAWYVEPLPPDRARRTGDWTLEFAVDGELVGRYTFAIVP